MESQIQLTTETNTSRGEIQRQILRYLKCQNYKNILMISINYVIDIVVITVLTSSKSKFNTCLHYVQCMHTKVRRVRPSDRYKGFHSQEPVSACIVHLSTNVTEHLFIYFPMTELIVIKCEKCVRCIA